jgi:acylphosphatase
MAGQSKLYLVRGRVQGVGFRFFVERVARELGVRGYVRNCADGSVEVYALGEEQELSLLRKELERGSRASRVEQVEEREAPRKHYQDFLIEPSA